MAKAMDKTRLSNTRIADEHYFKYSLWRGGFTNGGHTRFTHILLLKNEKEDSINNAFVSKMTMEKFFPGGRSPCYSSEDAQLKVKKRVTERGGCLAKSN